MVKNRKSAMKKRFTKPKPPSGCEFPIDFKTNTRSTSIANKKCVAAALGACGDDGLDAASRCMKEANYRFGYTKHFIQLVKLCAKTDAFCIDASKAGIQWIRENFEYIDAKNFKYSFQEAIIHGKATTAKKFLLGKVQAENTLSEPSSYLVPYDGGWHPATPAPPSKIIKDTELKKVLKTWIHKGIIEADAGKAIEWTANYIKAGKSLKDIHCILIGAGSAMGPCAKLLEHGANVVAIDIPGIW
eukprot:CAMPEP_0197318326 /NCGR_PEP_ID=MMETSP0891-20130614/50540_1 /TAXON_ID=44058 ORGANISM="Aureoumbra lagunensis, Strain CCMP1510" /NCGR_SAMPLE_ID=MMETSP0891 /ASSEMBLY_ACC=CAM_ASM_000534 /LENGTH=243 /DNA_ID=CAMNT_0042808711 /DNA_START=579 /DNA_END=1307 /DNA_ORIENTATION=+